LRELTDSTVNEFLNAQKPTTRYTYRVFLRNYLEFTGKTGQQLIDEKKADTDFKVEKSLYSFRESLVKGKSESQGTTGMGAIRGFYSYYRLPLKFNRSDTKKLVVRKRSTQDYFFDKEDLAKLSFVGNLKERYVLLVGKSLGLRAGDFVKLTFGQFRSLKLDNGAPIALGQIETDKENVKAFPFLDSDAIQIVKAWLDFHKDKRTNDKMIDDVEDNLTVILQNLCTKAGLEIEGATIHGKRVRFHCLRKFLIGRLSAYASESQWKQIVGKAISEGAYVSQDQLKGVFTRAMKDIALNGNSVRGEKLIELEDALLDSQKRITNLEVTNEVLRRKDSDTVNGLKEEFECLKTKLDKTERRNDLLECNLKTVTNALIGLKPIIDNMDEVVEFLEKRREEKEASGQVEADKSEIELREQIAKEITKKKFLKTAEEEMDAYRRDGYDR
jgi:hypothetical protein